MTKSYAEFIASKQVLAKPSGFEVTDSDINPSDTLQRESARHEEDSKHICPLQLTVIRRAIELWTNLGDVILSPFAGIGSEGYVAIQEGRRFIGAELKDTYYRQCVANLDNAVSSRYEGKLF